MVQPEALLVTLVKLVDWLPQVEAVPEQRRKRGRQQVYSDRLIIKALVIMIVRRLYSATSLLNFLEQETALTQQLRLLLTEKGAFPSRRTWERRLNALPDTLPDQIGWLGRCLVNWLQPWQHSGRAAVMDSTPLRANGGVAQQTSAAGYRAAQQHRHPSGLVEVGLSWLVVRLETASGVCRVVDLDTVGGSTDGCQHRRCQRCSSPAAATAC